ncbi:MAG: DUF6702 family protein [Blastocatellales bacterium]
MRNAECGMRSRMVLLRCLIITLTIVCTKAFSAELDVPHSAIRNPHLNIPRSHKIHVSVTHLEFNQPKQTVEIVIRVYTDDLENALSQRAKREVKIDLASAGKDRRLAEQVMAYLRSNFELKNKAGRTASLSWSGIEGQMDMFWLYVKGRMPGGLEGARMRNKIFCELFDDQVNIVNAKHQGKQIGLMFEAKDEFKALR